MKKLACAICLLAAINNLTFAQRYPFIGIFSDETYETCHKDVVPYTTNVLTIAAYLGYEIDAITAVEFAVDNWLGDPGYPLGYVSLDWTTTLVLIVTDIDMGVVLAFTTPVPGPYALLGTIEVMPFTHDWIGENHVLEVIPSPMSGLLAMVDEAYELHVVEGGTFTFNCVEPLMCVCYDFGGTATESSSWSSIKSLYQ